VYKQKKQNKIWCQQVLKSQVQVQVYKYKYLGFKYEYKYKYLDLVLEYNLSISTSTSYYSSIIVDSHKDLAVTCLTVVYVVQWWATN